MIKKYLLFALISLALLSCSKKSNEVTVTVTFKDPTGTTPVNRNYNITEGRIYLSHFELLDAAGNATQVKDLIIAKMSQSDDQNSFSFTMPSGTFTRFRFHFGLDSVTNNSNAASFADSHPLSLAQDMYWGMLKYRFIVVEGTIDSSATKDQSPTNPFSMHLGTDTLYREISSSMSSLEGGDAIKIEVPLYKLFILDQNTFDITSFSNHSSPAEIPNAVAIVNSLVSSMHADITHN